MYLEAMKKLKKIYHDHKNKFVVTEIRTKGTPADCAEFALKLIAFKQSVADAETFARMLADYEGLPKKEKDNWKLQGHCIMDDRRS